VSYIKSAVSHVFYRFYVYLCLLVMFVYLWKWIRSIIFRWLDSWHWASFICCWPVLAFVLQFYSSAWESVTSCCLGQYCSCIFYLFICVL